MLLVRLCSTSLCGRWLSIVVDRILAAYPHPPPSIPLTHIYFLHAAFVWNKKVQKEGTKEPTKKEQREKRERMQAEV